MVCLGRKFGVAAQTNPLSYGDPPPQIFHCCSYSNFICLAKARESWVMAERENWE